MCSNSSNKYIKKYEIKIILSLFTYYVCEEKVKIELLIFRSFNIRNFKISKYLEYVLL